MKIALASADSFSLWHHWRGLIRTLVERGDDVDVIGPDGPCDEKIRGLGAQRTVLAFNRFISPMADLRLFGAMVRRFRHERYDLVHTKEPKANLWGAVAARIAGVPHIVLTVSGLGFAFANTKSLKAGALKIVLSGMYRAAFACADRIWFENPDDRRLMIQTGRLRACKGVVIRSQGVDTDDYSLSQLDEHRVQAVRAELCGNGEGNFVVTMPIARMIWSKGVAEFVGAARRIAQRFPIARFVLVGPTEPGNPEAVPQVWLESNAALPNFKWFKFREDIREVIAASDAIALPSFYGEGVPRVLLEAMALERPIITTASVGCREVIRHGTNGIQVPARDVIALARAVEDLIRTDSATRRAMGREGRKLVEAEFSEKLVVRRVLAELYGVAENAAVDRAAVATTIA